VITTVTQFDENQSDYENIFANNKCLQRASKGGEHLLSDSSTRIVSHNLTNAVGSSNSISLIKLLSSVTEHNCSIQLSEQLVIHLTKLVHIIKIC